MTRKAEPRSRAFPGRAWERERFFTRTGLNNKRKKARSPETFFPILRIFFSTVQANRPWNHGISMKFCRRGHSSSLSQGRVVNAPHARIAQDKFWLF